MGRKESLHRLGFDGAGSTSSHFKNEVPKDRAKREKELSALGFGPPTSTGHFQNGPLGGDLQIKVELAKIREALLSLEHIFKV